MRHQISLTPGDFNNVEMSEYRRRGFDFATPPAQQIIRLEQLGRVIERIAGGQYRPISKEPF